MIEVVSHSQNELGQIAVELRDKVTGGCVMFEAALEVPTQDLEAHFQQWLNHAMQELPGYFITHWPIPKQG